MVEELSALDAELDRLGVEPAADSAALAVSYAGPLGGLTDVDAALNALAAGLDSGSLVAPRPLSTPPPPLLRSAFASEPPRLPEARLSESIRPADPDSAEIELPEPAHDLAEHSGELPLDVLDAADAPLSSTESGAFALPPDEPITEDVSFVDADLEELIEVDAGHAQLDEGPGRISEADRLVDAEFAELFSDAAGEPPHGYAEDDTEIFDSGAIAAIKAKGELEPIENAFNAEELDSAEFEIVMDSANDDRPHESSTSSISDASSPSTPPEKRPSFLGRLFGRKDE